MEHADVDPDDITLAKARYQATSHTYTQFSKAMGLPQQRERLYTGKASQVPAWSSIIKEPMKVFTKAEIEDIASEVNRVAGKYISKNSKWSGKMVIDPPDRIYGKLWNCDISTMSETAPHILLHEQLHARSISYFDTATYAQHWKMEEATVQLAAQEISKIEGIPIIESQYDELADGLRQINADLHLKTSDLEFAKTLLEMPVIDRLNWLDEQISDKMLRGGTIQEFQTLSELIDMLR